MNRNKYIIRFVMCIFLYFMYTHISYSQIINEIKLVDKEDNSPIEGVVFTYGNQSGISDENGIINLQEKENISLILSHIKYGEKELSKEKLKEVFKTQIYFMQEIPSMLYPITIIGTKENPNEISVTSQDRMTHDGAVLLNQIPEFNSIRKSGNYGFDPVFRGFKDAQLNVVMNGVQTSTTACPNRMDPVTSQMSPNMMEKVEIIKGPYALRYGSGLGATINFVSKELKYSKQENLYGRLSGKYESNGEVLRSEGQIGYSQKNYNVNVFSAWSQGNDYKDGNGETVPANFSRGSFGVSGGIKITDNQELKASVIHNVADDTDFPSLMMDLRKDDVWMLNLEHKIELNKKNLKSWNSNVYGSFVNHLMDNKLKELNPRMMNAETSINTKNYGVRTEGKWKFKNDELYTGLDIRHEQAEGERKREFLMGPNAGKTFTETAWQDGFITKSALFGEYHTNLNDFEFVFSSRLELNSSDVKNPDSDYTSVYSDVQKTQFNPNFSLGVSKAISNKIKLGAWLARVQRSGSLTERYINYFTVGKDAYEMLGNPNLNPEVNNQIDVVFDWSTSKTKVNVDVFASYLQDYISSVINPNLTSMIASSPGVRQYINISKAQKMGFELKWKQDLVKNIYQNVAIAYTYAQDLERDKPLPEIAPLDFRYSLQGNYFDGKFKPEISFRHVLRQSRISSEFGETETPSFSVFDFDVMYKLSKKVHLNAGILNLFDENYYEHLNRNRINTQKPIYAPGRNFYISFTADFN
ncbi:MAG: TonB-dependent receptor [Flavobacteriales bacterium]|nr:TonB-dependent receptor [Flavobacteriales bacterium]